MESDFLIPALIAWKDPGTADFVEILNKDRIKLNNCYAIAWASIGKLYFRFIAGDEVKISCFYSKEVYDNADYNIIFVESLPDEISQIKHLTLEEIEIIDEELFGHRSNTGRAKALKPYDYAREAAEKIYSLLKMNCGRRKYLKILKSVKKIQSSVRRYLYRKLNEKLRKEQENKRTLKQRAMKSIEMNRMPRKLIPSKDLKELRSHFQRKPQVYQVLWSNSSCIRSEG